MINSWELKTRTLKLFTLRDVSGRGQVDWVLQSVVNILGGEDVTHRERQPSLRPGKLRVANKRNLRNAHK
jgi:hypothetical protein